MRRIGTLAIALAAVVGVAAWPSEDVAITTERSPVDAALEAVSGSPDGGAAVVESEESAVRLASNALRPRAEWDLPKTYNDRVQRWIDYLSGRNRDRMLLWLEREGRYGGMIRERLAARGMPQDLVYLAMIESGLSPKAYSHAHAAGMWQFISETGRRYGLEVDGFVDERRDPVEATDAALDYLSELYDRFGSWYLAAAAYNSGENRVERILRQRAGGLKGDDALFWRIAGYLPRETRDYVPLMLAAAHIGKDPGTYGFHEIALQAPLSFREVTVPGGITLGSVARLAGVEPAVIEDLNPHLLRGITPPGRDWSVRVPEDRAERVAAGSTRLAEEERLATVTHRVGRGETMSHVARRYGVSVSLLRAANGNMDPRRLQVGQRLRVPVSPVAAVSGPTEWSTYQVRRGDTLWGIARRHGVSVRELRSWNGVGSRIYPGQRLRIAA